MTIDVSPYAEAKSDQLVADDLIGGPITVRITRVVGDDNKEKISIFYEGDKGKPWRPCKGMLRVLMDAWGKYADRWIGRCVTLYRNPDVAYGGVVTGGVRISHLSDITSEYSITVKESRKKAVKVVIKPLKDDAPAPEPAKAKGSPEAWAAEHIGAVGVAASLDSLEAVIKAGAKAVAKLAGAHPDLHQRVTDAYNIRRAELTPDEQPGDQFEGAEWAE